MIYSFFLSFFLHGAWRSIEGIYFSRNGRGKNQEAKDLLLYDIEDPTTISERKG